ncbi:MAG: NTP/NDP exchange transporter [Chlamydiae bacterium]|nr:NTP/NDP exchange transporter [Chlamydiota bacterium]
MSSTPEGFSKLRGFLWPVHFYELRKFVPMFLIFFFICFNYSILRATKDALICTAPNSGAEALPFLKVWAILPMALLFTFIFTRLSNRLSKEKVFYTMMGVFLLFFFLFAFVLYPFRDYLHPHQLADRLQAHLPVGFSGMVALFRNWTFTAFYIMSEMWSTMIMTVLFWGFANEVTSVKEAKRHYALLGMGANIATILSGQVSTFISYRAFDPKIALGTDAWGQALILLNIIIIISGFFSMAIFRWLHSKGLGYPKRTSSSVSALDEIKMGIRKNFSYLAKSKYLICIAVVVLMFNIALTLVEVVWKDQVKQLYPHPNDFNAYMGKIMTGIGIVATIGAFISGFIIRKFSWSTSALIPPFIILVTGIGFFSFLLFKDTTFALMATALGTTPLAVGVFFGSLQNCLARASKYTLFDATKELSFVPLSKESKLKGKAAIDGFGSRLGKSGASIIHQSLIMVFGSISLSTPFVALILLFVIGGWIAAVRSLGRQFQDLAARNEKITIATPVEVRTL